MATKVNPIDAAARARPAGLDSRVGEQPSPDERASLSPLPTSHVSRIQSFSRWARASKYLSPEELEEAEQHKSARRTNHLAEQSRRAAERWPRGIIHPHHHNRKMWDLFTVMLILWSAIVIPFSLAFRVQSAGLTVVAYVSDALFGLDVVLNFRTAIEDEETGIYLTSGRAIASRYVRGWFWVDVLSAIPFELFASHDAEATNLAKAFKFFRLLRMVRAIKLLRLMRVMRIINRLEMAFMVRHHVKALVSYFGVCLLASHWIACCYFAVGQRRG